MGGEPEHTHELEEETENALESAKADRLVETDPASVAQATIPVEENDADTNDETKKTVRVEIEPEKENPSRLKSPSQEERDSPGRKSIQAVKRDIRRYKELLSKPSGVSEDEEEEGTNTTKGKIRGNEEKKVAVVKPNVQPNRRLERKEPEDDHQTVVLSSDTNEDNPISSPLSPQPSTQFVRGYIPRRIPLHRISDSEEDTSTRPLLLPKPLVQIV